MSKIKNIGLDQYGAEPFKQQQFGTAGVEGVKSGLPTNSMEGLLLKVVIFCALFGNLRDLQNVLHDLARLWLWLGSCAV